MRGIRLYEDTKLYQKEISQYSGLNVIKMIGQGCFSTVFLAIDDKENPVAVKYFTAKANPFREISILEKLKDCQYIIKFINYQRFPQNSSILIQEFFDSVSLTKCWNNLDMNQIKRIAKMILIALKNIHSHNIVHCDLKPDNILVSPNLDDIRIIDFGCAQEISDKMINNNGARIYRPPEQLLGYEQYNEKADIWAFGICMLSISTHSEYDPWHSTRAMFQASNMASTYGKDNMLKLIKDLEIPENPEIISKMSDTITLPFEKIFTKIFPPYTDIQLREFIQSILVLNPNERPSAEQLLQHPFLTNA